MPVPGGTGITLLTPESGNGAYGVDGPILLELMQWVVVALSADEHFIASSVLRPVAP